MAAIAAETLAQAQAAAAAVVLELEPLPAAISMADALAPNAPLVHPDWRDYEVLHDGGARGANVAWEATVVRGDVDAAFARKDVEIVESTFRVGRQNHLSLEPRAVIASFEDGAIPYRNIHSSPVGDQKRDRAVFKRAPIRCPSHGSGSRRRVRP